MSIDTDLLLQSLVAEGEDIVTEMEQCLPALEEKPERRRDAAAAARDHVGFAGSDALGSGARQEPLRKTSSQ